MAHKKYKEISRKNIQDQRKMGKYTKCQILGCHGPALAWWLARICEGR
jgi:hypothetical protein